MLNKDEIKQALEIMSPFMEKGILLERFWPPCSAPKGWLSQLGGWPNFPSDWEWPRITFSNGTEASLDFVAQIDLKTLPRIPMRKLLPSKGILYFFVLAETNEPLAEFGSESWRVVYYPGDASVFPPRQPPDDAAWNLEDLDYAKSFAEEVRDPERPRWDLFPRCSVRPKSIKTWDARAKQSDDVDGIDAKYIRLAYDDLNALDQRTSPPMTSFNFSYGIEDALTAHHPSVPS